MATPARSRKVAPKQSSGAFLIGVLVGVLIGLGIALGVAFYLNKTPIPFASTVKPAGSAPEATKAPAIAGLPGSGAPALPGTAADTAKSGEKPKFDFYKILPGGGTTPAATPSTGTSSPTAAQTKPAPPGAEQTASVKPEPAKDVYYIQVGAYAEAADADNQKATLAMLGIDSNVDAADVPNKGTLYRVRLGPYETQEDLSRVRRTLAQNGIKGSTIKMKDARRTR